LIGDGLRGGGFAVIDRDRPLMRMSYESIANIRIADLPPGGVENIRMPKGDPEPDDPWLKPPPMQHPHGG